MPAAVIATKSRKTHHRMTIGGLPLKMSVSPHAGGQDCCVLTPASQPGEIVQAMHNSAQSREAIGFVSSISVAGGDSVSPRSGFVHPKHSPAQIHAPLPPSPGDF